MDKIVDQINATVSKFIYFEMSVFSFENSELVLVGSEDLLYSHSLLITFNSVHTCIIASDFIVNPHKPFIFIINETEEAHLLNLKYRIEVGNSIFKLITQDGVCYYIAADNIFYTTEIVKY